ncbi:MAG TPA: hypothetical protein VF519_02280 [Mycobacteriales bacterium]|jgi:hypothetical protein
MFRALALAMAAAHTITLSSPAIRPGESATVTGTTGCPEGTRYVVTLVYPFWGETAMRQFEGTTGADGGYMATVTLPEDAFTGRGSVESHVDCGESRANTVPFDVVPHEGTLTVTPASVAKGATVRVSGTNCWGPAVTLEIRGKGFRLPVYEFGLERNREAHTFVATVTLPASVGPGAYVFDATCAGSVFDEAAFTVTGTPAAPPATPVVDTPRFTG